VNEFIRLLTWKFILIIALLIVFFSNLTKILFGETQLTSLHKPLYKNSIESKHLPMIESTRNINSFSKCRQLKASISRNSGFTERDGSNRKFTFPHTTINRQVTTDNNTTLEAQNPLKERNYVTIKGGAGGGRLRLRRKKERIDPQTDCRVGECTLLHRFIKTNIFKADSSFVASSCLLLSVPQFDSCSLLFL
jgi:hypothetical protein